MKLIQLNAWGGKLDRQIESFIKTESADILCLQEVMSISQGDTGLFLPLEVMQEISGLQYLAFAPVFSFAYMQRTARFGNAIISRYPIEKSEIVFTNQAHTEDFDFLVHKSANMRNFIHAVINLGGSKVNVLTHHGYHIPDHKNGDGQTLKQMKQLATYIDELSGPVILTGDFNLAPRSESLEIINNRLTNLAISHKLTTTRTVLTHKTEVCDYIFVSQDIKTNRFEVSDELVSDHKALILEFDI